VSDLTADKEYWFTVTCMNAVGESPMSDVFKFKTCPPVKPSLEGLLKDIQEEPAKSHNLIKLQWTHPESRGMLEPNPNPRGMLDPNPNPHTHTHTHTDSHPNPNLNPNLAPNLR